MILPTRSSDRCAMAAQPRDDHPPLKRAFCGIVGGMSLRDGIGTALSLALVLAVCGCGSGGAPKGEGGVSSCQPTASSLGTMSWLDDGTQECAVSALATFDNTPQLTMFSLTGATTTLGIGFGVTTVLGPGAIGGSYSCAPLDSLIVTFNYTQGQTNTFAGLVSSRSTCRGRLASTRQARSPRR